MHEDYRWKPICKQMLGPHTLTDQSHAANARNDGLRRSVEVKRSTAAVGETHLHNQAGSFPLSGSA
jgi:hypothetical protein